MKFMCMLKRTTLAPIFLALVLLSGISCSSSPAGPAPDVNIVSLRGDRYSPVTLTIARGETVTWMNDDDDIHTATSDYGDGGWNTGNIPVGASRSITFYSAGTYPYHCIYHVSQGMRGTIIVQ